MKYRLQHIFLTAPAPSAWLVLALCLALTACGLEEPVDTPSTSGGYIEFVARPTGFNNQTVATKSQANDFENKIENCFFLVFDATTGDRVGFHTLNSPSWNSETPHIKLDTRGLKKVTACFLINVPSDFASGIIGTTKPADAPEADNNKYLNTAVLSGITYGSGTNFGIPDIDLDGAGPNDAVPCIPMFGVTPNSVDISTTSISTAIGIPIERLFAKVTFNLSMDLKDTGTLAINTNTYFELISYQILNLPKMAQLMEPATTNTAYETNWQEEKAYEKQSVNNAGNTPIYNKGALGYDDQKSYTFSLYVPEYYLTPYTSEEFEKAHKDDEKFDSYAYDTQECKPLMYDKDNKTAIYVKLKGLYKPVNGGNIGLEYDLYLGENKSNSFTLKRNKHYTNNVVITGVNDRDLDCRVTVTEGGDMIDVYGEVANCYAVSSTGDFRFKAYKGAYKYDQLATAPKCSAGTTVEIIAQDNNGVTFVNPEGSSNPFTVTDDPHTEGLKVISFKVSEISSDCNMVIALKNGETTEWTWHLWFIKGLSLGNMGFFELGTQDMPDNKGKMMDMNLGVTRSLTGDWIGGAATGFYYKYGHRAPYFEDKLKGNGKKYHGGDVGTASTWNVSGKAASDPCPPGYRVPTSSVWTNQGSHSTVPDAYKYASLSTTNIIYYPYSRYIKSDYSLLSAPTVTLDKSAGDYTYSVPNITDYSEVTVKYSRYSFTLQFPISKTVSDVTFAVNTTASFGELWASNGLISYGSASASLLSGNTSVKLYKLTTTRVKSVTAKGIKWDGWTPKLDYDINEYESSYQYNTGLSDEVAVLMLTDYLVRGGTVSSAGLISSTSIPNDSRGVQVRCIKE